MATRQIEFTKLEQKTAGKRKSALDFLAPELGKAYVVSIVRDGCPGCARLKPKLDALEKTLTEMYGSGVVFVQVHVAFSSSDNKESLRSKGMLGHYFYPTVLVLIRTKDNGAFEYYRNVSPRMSELRRNIEDALKTAMMLKKST